MDIKLPQIDWKFGKEWKINDQKYSLLDYDSKIKVNKPNSAFRNNKNHNKRKDFQI